MRELVRELLPKQMAALSQPPPRAERCQTADPP
jgi:hypothetical protein